MGYDIIIVDVDGDVRDDTTYLSYNWNNYGKKYVTMKCINGHVGYLVKRRLLEALEDLAKDGYKPPFDVRLMYSLVDVKSDCYNEFDLNLRAIPVDGWGNCTCRGKTKDCSICLHIHEHRMHQFYMQLYQFLKKADRYPDSYWWACEAGSQPLYGHEPTNCEALLDTYDDEEAGCSILVKSRG